MEKINVTDIKIQEADRSKGRFMDKMRVRLPDLRSVFTILQSYKERPVKINDKSINHIEYLKK